MTAKKKVVTKSAPKKAGYIAVHASSNGIDDFNANGTDPVFFGKTVCAACKNFNTNEDSYADIEVYELVLVGTYKPNSLVTFKQIA